MGGDWRGIEGRRAGESGGAARRYPGGGGRRRSHSDAHDVVRVQRVPLRKGTPPASCTLYTPFVRFCRPFCMT